MAKYKYLLPLLAALLFSSPVWSQGNPFEVDTTTINQTSTGSGGNSQTNSLVDNGNSGKKNTRSGFFSSLLDAIKDFFDSFSSAKNKSDPDKTKSTAKASKTGKTGNLDPQTASDQLATAKDKKNDVPPTVKAPEVNKPDKPSGKGASIGSENFKTWFADAARLTTDWEFPDITNKYGQKISREDYLRAIIWIESRGIHSNSRGSVTKSWAGALGFMQLMPNTARGLKIDPKDPAQNLKGGAKYLKEIFNSGNVSKKDGAEKLIMGACAYNLGPFSKSMKLSWEKFKISKVPVETRSYGLKVKMCLGLELSADERLLVEKWLVNEGQTVDSVIEDNYKNAMGIAR